MLERKFDIREKAQEKRAENAAHEDRIRATEGERKHLDFKNARGRAGVKHERERTAETSQML